MLACRYAPPSPPRTCTLAGMSHLHGLQEDDLAAPRYASASGSSDIMGAPQPFPRHRLLSVQECFELMVGLLHALGLVIVANLLHDGGRWFLTKSVHAAKQSSHAAKQSTIKSCSSDCLLCSALPATAVLHCLLMP